MSPEDELDEIRRHLEEAEERAGKLSDEGKAREQQAHDASSPVPSMNPPRQITEAED
jgi:hypothetical protein